MRLGAVMGGIAQGYDTERADQRAQDQEDFLKDQQTKLKAAQGALKDATSQYTIGAPIPLSTATSQPISDTLAQYGMTQAPAFKSLDEANQALAGGHQAFLVGAGSPVAPGAPGAPNPAVPTVPGAAGVPAVS